MLMITGLKMESKNCPRCNAMLLYHWVENRCFTCGYNDYSKDINILDSVDLLREIMLDRSTKYIAEPFVIESEFGVLNIKKVFIKVRQTKKEKNRKWQSEKSSLSAVCDFCTKDYNKPHWMDLIIEVKSDDVPSRFVLKCKKCKQQIILIKKNRITWRHYENANRI